MPNMYKKPGNRRISHFIQSPFLMGIGSSDGKEGRTSRRCLSNADTSSVLIERNGHRKGRGESGESGEDPKTDLEQKGAEKRHEKMKLFH